MYWHGGGVLLPNPAQSWAQTAYHLWTACRQCIAQPTAHKISYAIRYDGSLLQRYEAYLQLILQQNVSCRVYFYVELFFPLWQFELFQNSSIT